MRLWAVFTASDPGWGRLRSAGTTVATLVVALCVLYGLVSLWSQPVTSAILGVVVAMIASLAVNESDPARRAMSIGLLIPSAAATAALAAVLGPHPVIADCVFVVVAIGAVFLRLIGPRGTAMGMIGFMAYFLALFVQVKVGQLPVVIVAAAVGALVAFGMRFLLRSRHPDRDLHRTVAALGVRAGSVVDVLGQAFDEDSETWPSSRLRSRLTGCGETALTVEEQLNSAGDRLFEGFDNDELSVRIFDFHLTIEHLASVAVHVQPAELPAAGRTQLVAALSSVAKALQTGTDAQAATRVRELATGLSSVVLEGGPGRSVDVESMLHAVQVAVAGWLRVVDPQPEDTAASADDTGDDEHADAADDDGTAEDDGPASGRWGDTARQAVQVGLAAALAIVVGELISPTRWFWAAIAAFVVFTGTATRGETLSKGWQRVVGTVAGVVAGVVVAALVGGSTVAALLLILVSVFLGLYLMRISSAWMIFFMTLMLALLYGLLGQFSVGLLLVRLEETAAGAAIGVLVSFVVFPSSTRDAAKGGAGDFLTDLAELLGDLTGKLAGERSGGSSAQAEARNTRGSFNALKATSKPLTDGLAGLGNRSEYRRTLHVLGACEHHARALARLADSAPATAADPALRSALIGAVQAVRDNVDIAATSIAGDLAGVMVHPADALLDAVDAAAAAADGLDQSRLLAIGRHLRAMDQAVCGLATDRGAHVRPLEGAR